MALLQLGVLGLGLFIDGNVGVGAFPQSKEVLVGGFRFGVIALHCIRSTQLPVRQSAYGIADHDAAVNENLLEFGGRFGSLV